MSLQRQEFLTQHVHNIRTFDSVFAEIWPILLELPKLNFHRRQKSFTPTAAFKPEQKLPVSGERQRVELINSSLSLHILEIGHLDDTVMDPDPLFRSHSKPYFPPGTHN
ncbi:hypothetical protein BGZ74_002763 [Mortierella antarctica]|nr:hypothetical protein BGZ74_002763 [Mortierella antarctica]